MIQPRKNIQVGRIIKGTGEAVPKIALEAVDYDIVKLVEKRDQLVDIIITDPKSFAATLYIDKGAVFGKKILFSPYLTLDDEQFCCLLNRKPSTSQIVEWNSIGPKVCVHHKWKELPEQGKQGKV